MSGLTFTDMFCGAGGSSIGASEAGGELRLGLNHWERAIETHARNFDDADHACQDVSSLTTAQIRRYPDTDILLASPECTNHTLAKGGRRVKPVAPSLFDDGPAGSDEQDRSRATMWDVVRFAEQKLLKGVPYKAIVVENVVEAYKWGYGDDGGLFAAWRQAMTALGYESEIVYLNSMFAPPTPQSRDRMYVVFWLKTVRRPNLRVEPVAWCPTCSAIVNGRQTFKRSGTQWGRYGAQYFYSCPVCYKPVLPGVFPAASAIDWSLEAQRIGSRDKPLADKTRERIKRGLERLANEPFAFRLLQSGTPKPLTLPFVTLTTRQDLGMVIPVAGNTFERTPGNRARHVELHPLDTVHGTLDRALVVANRMNNVPHLADLEAAPPMLTGSTVGVVQLQQNGEVTPMRQASHTIRAAGRHHALVMRNNGDGASSGWESTPVHEAVRALTTACHQSLVVPYDRTGVPFEPGAEPASTLTTRDRLALLIPPAAGADDGEQERVSVSQREIDDCGFRMFDLGEIARTMKMEDHPSGGEYVVVGNKRERMAQYGNAVTPPVMRLLFGRLSEALDEAA